MGFFRSLKGDLPDKIGQLKGQNTSNKEKSHGLGHTKDYISPHGHSSLHTNTHYEPPPGPPPSYGYHEHDPLANQASLRRPSTEDSPTPYHDWTSIPDTALLPPPPALGHMRSPNSNAPLDAALRAHQWCMQYPLVQPHQPASHHIMDVRHGHVELLRPPEYNGSLSLVGIGICRASSQAGNRDSCLLTSLPLYFAMVDSPFLTEISKTFYFEVNVKALGRGRDSDGCSLAIGFCGVPYPTWRMPGWERGSLAVHSDDGRRYVNDTDGGIDFVSPFVVGETVGIGVTYAVPNTPPDFRPSPVEGCSLKAEVFLTRDGRRAGSWNLHEELDAGTDFGIMGLDGKHDLYGAIGTFGEVAFEARFRSRDWLWRPS
ncbi:hypothetical protein MMC13_008231 [Lambiella insularis]|nr:hypothetical protein [Lambiella insularis]